MFKDNTDFYPTPDSVIAKMLQGVEVSGKVILEPSAGKGNIIDYLTAQGVSNILYCEKSELLQRILADKGKFLCGDFLTLTSEQISHVDMIVMNPPFSEGVKHVLHAYSIAPAGCRIISLINTSNLKNDYTNERKELNSVIESYGNAENLGDCFGEAERKTGVEVSLIKLQKPAQDYKTEFAGFFTEEEEQEEQANGIMSYNAIRDLVNRYVAAVKLYDEQLNTGAKMNALLSDFYGQNLTFSCTEEGKPKLRNDFKKDLQKAGWKWIFSKMNMRKYATRGLNEDINKFVEQQTQIPFTMKNIYHMLDVIAQTNGQRMDKAILEVFDRVTEHHADNRHNLKGWKTNSHFLMGKKFILPYMINPAKEYGYTSDYYNSLRSSYDGIIPDLEKALCFVTGTDYEGIKTINASINRNTYGEWYTESEFFKYKGYKNGNMHFEFKEENVWALLNQRVAKLKGYPLYEEKKQTAYQDRQTGRKQPQKQQATKAPQQEAEILFTVTL